MSIPVHHDHFTGGYNGVNTGTFPGTLASARTNELVLVTICSEPNSASDLHVTSITDSVGLVFQKYADDSFTSGGPVTFCRHEVWWAYGALPSTSYSVTINTNIVADNLCANIDTFGGVNAAAPFDPNASLPVKGFVGNSVSHVKLTGISTTEADTYIIAMCSTPGNNTNDTPTFNTVAPDFDNESNWSNGTNWAKIDTGGKVFATPQTNLTVQWRIDDRVNQIMMAFALNGDAVVPPGPPAARATLPSIRVISGPTGPTGTFKGVRIFANITGPTGLYKQFNQIAPANMGTGASGATGNWIGPTGARYRTVYPISGALSPTGNFETIIIKDYANPF